MKTEIMLFACLSVAQAIASVRTAELMVVDDETGSPMTNVMVKATFRVDNGWEAFKGPASPNVDVQPTDRAGRCRLSGETNTGGVYCEAIGVPAGYYGGCGVGYKFGGRTLGLFQTDAHVATIRVQRVIRPIPLGVCCIGGYGMVSCRTNMFEKGGGRLSWDMLKADWLPPLGTGSVADIVFDKKPREQLEEFASRNGSRLPRWKETMLVSFPGAGNGIVEVEPAPGPLAVRSSPTAGFVNERDVWEMIDERGQRSSSMDVDRKFCLRIRSKFDQQGRLTSAHYGKIYGNIGFIPLYGQRVTMASPSLLYYVNFTPLDTNLEWDGKNNLLSGRGEYRDCGL